jgi:serine/threonine protein kinase
MSEPTTEIPGQHIDIDLEQGQLVGEYEACGKLGQGAFGTVFKAVHPLIGKVVAIKVLARRFSVDPEMVSRFVAEARAVNQIRHRHIIDIFSFGQLEDGRHYYVMEYLDGETLDALIERERKLPIADVLAILRAIGKALDAAHAKGIAHRDLKAENIFLGKDPDGAGTGFWPKLLDFGIAKLLGPEDTLAHKTRTGAPIGTPYYMSPEQCRGREVDHRTDHYAFGVLAYLMLTGTYPFDGDSYMSILMQQISDQPPLPSAHEPELPAEIDDVVMWLMAKAPADRPPDLRTAVRALEEAAERAGLMTAKPTSSWDVQTGPSLPGHSTQPPHTGAARIGSVKSVPPVPSETIVPAPERSRVPMLAIVGTLAVVAAAVVALVALGMRFEPSPPAAPVTATPPPPAPVVEQPPAPPVQKDATPQTVIISIEGTPDGTEVFGGGMTVGSAPGPVQLPYSTDPIVLTFKVDGYLPMSKSLVPDHDQPLAVTLKKKAHATTGIRSSKDELLDPFGAKK